MVMEKQVLSDPAAFDNLAAGYDDSFTTTDLGRLLRARVWRHLGENYHSGQRILDLACGTGEDALWLAGRGIEVTAMDGSAEMVRIATEKINHHELSDMVHVIHCSIQEFTLEPLASIAQPDYSGSQHCGRSDDLPDVYGNTLFDGALSNFGGLNVIDNLSQVAGALAALIKPGGRLVLVPMGMICPWEIGWYMAHGRLRSAFRRFGRSPSAQLGGSTIPVWYPTPGHIARDFKPFFKLVNIESLGLLLPPTYLEHFVRKSPNLFARLNSLEMKVRSWSRGWGDHYIAILEKS
jgi:SAM-dependent methyltransferase